MCQFKRLILFCDDPSVYYTVEQNKRKMASHSAQGCQVITSIYSVLLVACHVFGHPHCDSHITVKLKQLTHLGGKTVVSVWNTGSMKMNETKNKLLVEINHD
ncbi:hypothetical protein RvY_03100 [Ramazzottius varieornatus]|uniref:Uncharacterized protein n=1 Tax=Ramazzottius varieornatus TaxID=947166 RepID=A0A1D1USM5_RAMVA|nr:hypothetical protein RvY_03100 [Ramazzottius varieornatus]